jgi:hypothetical protein
MTRQRWIILGFAVIFALGMGFLLLEARAMDAWLGGLVPITGDDHEYHRLAVNLRYGYGWTESILPPIEQYHYDFSSDLGQQFLSQFQEQGIVDVDTIWDFYRAPGYPAFLSIFYTVFGTTSLVGRSMTAVLVGAIALLITLTGSIWAGWRGALAGGIAGLLYMTPGVIRIWGMDALMTEVSSTFWVTLFAFFFVLYQKTHRPFYFVFMVFALIWALFTRANLVTLLPLLFFYFIAARVPRLLIAFFVIALAVPLVLWAAFASSQMGRLVTMTTQGEIAFPQYHNIQVLEGIGPDRLYQGDWNLGRHFDENGVLVPDWRFAPQPGENGWVKGFRFWLENPLQVPALFFVKLRAGFWTKEGIAGLYTLGLCFLFISLGFRKPGERKRVLPNLSNRQILALQIGLALAATIIMAVLHTSLYLLVLGIYAAMIVLALLRPYGDVFTLPYPSPVWFLTFVASHFITTILFMGVRFHEPLDPLLCMFGAFGLILLIEYILSGARRRRASYVLQPG